MQDRFKFRFWYKPLKIMVPTKEKDYIFDFANNDNYVIMQCTGLKDKNGTLIYEGDIVKTSKGIANVEYDNTYAYFGLTNFLTVFSFDNFINEEIEVIGNIYQDSHLLEELRGVKI